MPAYRIESPGDAPRSYPPPVDADAEPVESLSLPPGMGTEPPPADDVPRTPAAARLSFTYLARELGRELRVRHGLQLRTDLEGLEIAQSHLREALPDGRIRSPDDERQVMRAGGFLAELLARRLGGRWADLESLEPSTWSMLVPFRGGSRDDDTGALRDREREPPPHEGTRDGARDVMRVWPFGRVLRFVAMGHKERDLVSYYLELDLRARGP